MLHCSIFHASIELLFLFFKKKAKYVKPFGGHELFTFYFCFLSKHKINNQLLLEKGY